MRHGLREAGTDRSPYLVDAAKKAPVPANRLRIRFVSGRDTRAADLAAHCTRALAHGSLQIDVEHGANDRATDLDGAQASVVVVIHVAGEAPPLIADECGGRVDWRIERDALSEGSTDLAGQLRRQAGRLLADLGYLAPETLASHGSPRRDLPAAPSDPYGPDLLAA